jgi:hypothetical protein
MKLLRRRWRGIEPEIVPRGPFFGKNKGREVSTQLLIGKLQSHDASNDQRYRGYAQRADGVPK